MKSKQSVTRRAFIGTAAIIGSVGSAVVGPTLLRGQSSLGKKGNSYPDQRRKYKDSKSGHTVWQLTNTPGRNNHAPYFNTRHVTPDGRWLIYNSDRASEQVHQFNLFKMDLRTGESVQLTETGNVVRDSVEMTRDGKDVYFFDRDNAVRVVALETLKEREVCRLPKNVLPPPHNISVSSDRRFLTAGLALERKINHGYVFAPWTQRQAIFVIQTDTGKYRYLLENTSPIGGHTAFCPTNDNLLLYDQHAGGGWVAQHRVWVINMDGTGNRPILPTTNGEGVGHEIWGASGKTIYAVISGGRQPQGLWVFETDGGNERCVLSGPAVAHCTVNPAEDRFVVDERLTETDALWISRKGSHEPEVLCQMTDWFVTKPDGSRQATEYHPHLRFTPSGTGVTFTNAANVYLVEV